MNQAHIFVHTQVRKTKEIICLWYKNISSKLNNRIIKESFIKFTDEENLRRSSEVVWQDEPDFIQFEYKEDTKNIYSKAIQELFKSKNRAPKKNKAIYKPHTRFVSVYTNVYIIKNEEAEILPGFYRIAYFDDDIKAIGPLVLSSADGSRTLLVEILRRLGVLKLIRYRFSRKMPSVSNTIDVGIILAPPRKNYGHWLLEDLLKVHRALKYKEITGIQPTILLGDVDEWQLETLKKLGIDSNNWRQIRDNSIFVESFLSTDSKNVNSFDFDVCKEDYEWLSSQIKQNTSLSKTFGNKIFLSRQDCPWRNIINYAETEEILKDHGFEIQKPENLEFEEQVSMFSEADIIVGVVGAGFANMIFGENLHLIPIYPPGPWIPAIYFVIAQTLDHYWHPIFSIQLDKELRNNSSKRNVYVDGNELERKIETLMERIE